MDIEHNQKTLTAGQAPAPTPTLKSKIRAFYHRNEKYAEPLIFIVGFIWDSFTMTRVDNVIDHVILLFYLSLIAAMIILILRKQCGVELPKWIQKNESKLLYAMQFCYGGLFSSFVIFYFKSTSWTKTFIFFLFLVGIFIGNEFLKERLRNRELLAVLYCFCLFSFLAFFLPVILEAVEVKIFVLAGFLSLIVSFAVFGIGLRPNRSEWRSNMIRVGIWIGSVWFAINVLFFCNLIPPVPLALKVGHPYHKVTRTAEGYEVQYVEQPFYRFWRKWDDPFYYTKGERVYCYTAIFAPKKVRVRVYHVWSCDTPKGWKQTDRLPIDIISGGREGGFRGYTFKSSVKPGDWKVEVETERGQTLGVIEFAIEPSPDPHPPLVKKLWE
jgi:hypothetical protein